MNTRSTQLILLGLASGILLALLIAPQTRWLVRLQALTLLHQYRPLLPLTWAGGTPAYYTTSEANDLRLYHAAAARHPGDFGLQYANATQAPQIETVANLRALTHRFPNNPMLLANLLRYESSGIHSSRIDDFLLLHEPVPKNFPYNTPSTPKTLALYDRDAAAGERADPDNAYFPLMRASGLFAARRDAEALAAVQRASVKPLWHEYLTDDDEAQWHLHAEAFHDPGAMPQATDAAGQILWQYGSLRETARLVAYQAILAEQAGHLEQGLALREALRRCGDLMRVQSTTLIGSLVGIAVAAISETRPGGPFLKDDASLTPEQKAQKRLDAYCAYVTKIGHPEAAQRAREEEAARRSVQTLDDPKHLSEDWTRPLVQCSWWWLADLATLLNIGWLLALGVLAAVSRLRKPAVKPLFGWKSALEQFLLAAGCWVFLALLFVCISGVWLTVVFHAPIDWRMTFGVGGVFGLAAWVVGRGISRLPHLRRIAVLKTAALLPVLAGAVYGLYSLTLWLAGPLAEIPANLRLLTGLSGSDGTSDAEQALQIQTLWLCAAASLAVPLLLAVGLILTALVRRVPLVGAVGMGFSRLALLLACLLVLVYGGLLIGTVQQERRLSAFTRQVVLEGGRYFAARAGQSWPGSVQ